MNQAVLYANLARKISSIPNPTDHSDFTIENALETYTALKFIIGQCADHMERLARIEQATKVYVELIKQPEDTLEWQIKAMTEVKNLVNVYDENATTF